MGCVVSNSKIVLRSCLCTLVLASCLSFFAAAQQTAQVSGGDGSVRADPSPAAKEAEIQKKEQSQRVLGVVPMFSVTNRQNAPPLTPGQKFHLFVRGAFDPFVYVAAGVQAGIGQATNQFEGYGQGASGFGKRYGAALADGVSSQFFSNFFYPVLLKQDPRYFRLGEGTLKHRTGYALAQEFVCHSDKGGRSFCWSNTLGAVSTGGLSNVYYPQGDRGFGLTMSRAGISLLWGVTGCLFDEFWPDIHDNWFHKH
jgi:hypothetical protein